MNIGKCVEPPAIGGMLIAYEDHIAQVKRAVAVALSEIDQVQRLAEEAVAEQMRAACIAAVEHDIECRFVCDPDTDERDCTCHYLRIVARLRQVQP